MDYTASQLDEAWSHCSRHRADILRSAQCGCFSCELIFAPEAITEWVDEPENQARNLRAEPQSTAACPRCTLDSVLPGAVVALSPALLKAMYGRYFGTSRLL